MVRISLLSIRIIVLLLFSWEIAGCVGLKKGDQSERWQAANQAGLEAVRRRDFKTAEEFYDKAAKEAASAGDERGRLASLNALADMYANQGKLEEARQLYLTILQAQERLQGSDSTALIPALNNVVRVTCVGGECTATLPYLKQLLEIRTKAFGPGHRDVLMTLGLIGETYEKKGDYGEALTYFQKKVSIGKRIFGPEDPFVLASSMNSGRVYLKMGDYAQAGMIFREALEIEEKHAWPEGPVVHATITGYQEVLRKTGHKAQADSLTYKPRRQTTGSTK
jgi:tetratricopeptide (TPR) repeat protein